jgi:hypothetical protein
VPTVTTSAQVTATRTPKATKQPVTRYTPTNTPIQRSPTPSAKITLTPQLTHIPIKPSATATNLPVVATHTALEPSATATKTALDPSATATKTALEPSEIATKTALDPSAIATKTALEPSAIATETALEASATATKTALEASATAITPLSNQSGTLSVTSKELIFPNLTLQGSDIVLEVDAGSWNASDTTGSGNGWQVIISASDFTNETGHTIPVTGFMVQLDDDDIKTIAGNTPPMSLVPNATTLSPQGTTILAADIGEGIGSYDFTPHFKLFIPGFTTVVGNYRTPSP